MPTWSHNPTVSSLQFQAIGDFDGNQKADILWRSQFDGQLYIWFGGKSPDWATSAWLDSPTYQNGSPANGQLGPGDPAWQVQAVGDFDHDGHDDILWRHTDGRLSIWRLSGSHFLGQLDPRVMDNAWAVKGLLHDAGR